MCSFAMTEPHLVHCNISAQSIQKDGYKVPSISIRKPSSVERLGINMATISTNDLGRWPQGSLADVEIFWKV